MAPSLQATILRRFLNLLGYHEAQRSLLGIAILLAAAVVMPWLTSQKRNLAVVTASAAPRADAAESAPWLHGVDCSCGTRGEPHLQ